MKIVFLNRYFFPDHSATSQLLTDLAFDLAAAGIDVHVVTSRQRYDEPAAALPASEIVQGVQVHRVWTSRFGRHWLPGRALDYLSYYFSVAVRLMRLLRPGDIVVAKTDPPLISVIAATIARARGATLVNWLQDLFPEVAVALGMKGLSGTIGRRLRRWRNRSLESACANVVLGHRGTDRLRAEGVRGNIVVIPNWADGATIAPLPHERNGLRAHWGLNGKFVVGYSGNMGRVHEMETMLGAAILLRDRPDIVFLFIGGGPRRAAVQAAAVQSGLKNIVFHPYQPRERLRESLGAIDLHWISLLPAMEGLIVPSKFYGIAAAGRPTLFIGDRDGEIARLLRAAACGLAVEIGDSAAASAAIVSLCDDAPRRLAMGENARRLFEQQFDQPIALAKWRQLLQQAGDRPGATMTRDDACLRENGAVEQG